MTEKPTTWKNRFRRVARSLAMLVFVLLGLIVGAYLMIFLQSLVVG